MIQFQVGPLCWCMRYGHSAQIVKATDGGPHEMYISAFKPLLVALIHKVLSGLN